MGLFDSLFGGLDTQAKSKSKVSVKECKQMVLQFFKKYGMDAEDSELDVEDGFGWLLQKGSASIIILISKSDLINDFTINVYSPILKLPNSNILPFYRRCLELNFLLISCALCVQKDEVLVIAERSLEGLSYEELEFLILNVASAADGCIPL